jgi:hypothetical protein
VIRKLKMACRRERIFNIIEIILAMTNQTVIARSGSDEAIS